MSPLQQIAIRGGHLNYVIQQIYDRQHEDQICRNIHFLDYAQSWLLYSIGLVVVETNQRRVVEVVPLYWVLFGWLVVGIHDVAHMACLVFQSIPKILEILCDI